MQWTAIPLMLAVLLCLVLLSVRALGNAPAAVPPTEPTGNPDVTVSPPITREDLRRLGVLTTLIIPVEQTIEAQRTGLVGGVRCILLARGELTLGVDLSIAELTVDTGTTTLTITLPQPVITQSRLDHERSHILALERLSLWRLVLGDALVRARSRLWVMSPPSGNDWARLTVVSAESIPEKRPLPPTFSTSISSSGFRHRAAWSNVASATRISVEYAASRGL